MHIPPPLKNGDEIRVISTARKISELELQPAILWMKQQGFTPSFGKHLFNEFHQFSGTDEDRAQDLIEALTDPKVKAIWCARGGYGSIRLMPYLEKIDVLPQLKWVIGYSDVTVLHAWLQTKKMVSLHATMPINVANNTSESLSSIYSFMTHQTVTYDWEGERTKDLEVTGKIVGGNLSILYALNGTPWQFHTDDCILFIEDLDEYLYHIDRMLQTLKYGGWFKHVKAFLVGGMTKMNDNDISFGFTAKESIKNMAASLNIPVVFDFPAGHQNHNLALPIGQEATLITGKKNKLIFG